MQTTPDTSAKTLLSLEVVDAPETLEKSPAPTQDNIAEINAVKFTFKPILFFQNNIYKCMNFICLKLNVYVPYSKSIQTCHMCVNCYEK
jgi:hypothetical protein